MKCVLHETADQWEHCWYRYACSFSCVGGRGLLIRVHHQVFCPCERHLDHCGSMHSRDELICVFVRDTLTFSEMLRGDDTIE